MILIIPIILGAVALVTAGAGVAAGVSGFSKMDEAKKIGENAQWLYEKQRKYVENILKDTEVLAENYGQLQVKVRIETIGRFVTFIERIGQKASQEDIRVLESLDGATPQQIEEYEASVMEANLWEGGLKAVGTAYAAGQGAIALIGLFGTASTGAAISGLSGAAAWNATLAWLGGGSLAASGGGMALGSLVLGGIAIGPALMIGGFALGGEGEKALTEALRYQAEANIEIAKLESFEDFLREVQRRIKDLKNIVQRLNLKAIDELTNLESQPFDAKRDAVKFQQVALLVKAIAEIVKTPVLDSDGNLNQATANLKARYSNL